MDKLLLNGNDWELIYVKNSVYAAEKEVSSLRDLRDRGYSSVPASVPGNLEIDLQNAGVINDPFYGDNHSRRDCEYLHAFYIKQFEYNGGLENPSLVFEGLDTVAEIYINDCLIGKTDNMLISHEIELGGSLKTGINNLMVHIKPAVIEARKYKPALGEYAQPYNRDSLYLRKAPHMFAWDIMPRLVSAGIWKDVYLNGRKKERISEFYIYTARCDTVKNTAELVYMTSTVIADDESMNYKVTVEARCGKSFFSHETPLYTTSAMGSIKVNDAKFWWPRFSGEQNLYIVKVKLFKNDEIIDAYNTKIGIRTISLDRTSITDEKGNGEFCVIVNDKKIFCMGTNWVPVDALHSRDADRIPEILPMLTDINCNIIRMWGGNVYENDMVYDFCDENGILIWQDFAMGCAIYPQDENFQKVIFDEASAVIKRLRQHPSIALWSGDNEVDLVYMGWDGMAQRDPNQNVLSRKVLYDAVRIHDYPRVYLPSSPYIDRLAYDTGGRLPEDHLWGPRDYFKGEFYKNSVAHFASEIGYHGCTSPKSIEKFIPNEYVWTSENSDDWKGIDNKMWLFHCSSPRGDKNCIYSYRIKLMASHVTTLFGNSVPNTLEDFAMASQISQAEAKKYFIEKFRVSKWRRTGIIWWNLIDGWPQFSDAVVDYYFVKKLAYHYIKRSQNPVCMIFDEPCGRSLSLYAVNEFDTVKELNYKVTDLTDRKIKTLGEVDAEPESSTFVCNITIDEGEKHFYFIEWEMNGRKYSNHYMTNIIDIDYEEYVDYIKQIGYYEFEGI